MAFATGLLGCSSGAVNVKAAASGRPRVCGRPPYAQPSVGRRPFLMPASSNTVPSPSRVRALGAAEADEAQFGRLHLSLLWLIATDVAQPVSAQISRLQSYIWSIFETVRVGGFAVSVLFAGGPTRFARSSRRSDCCRPHSTSDADRRLQPDAGDPAILVLEPCLAGSFPMRPGRAGLVCGDEAWTSNDPMETSGRPPVVAVVRPSLSPRSDIDRS